MVAIGVISDTHGMIRPAAISALRGVSQILHAGDIGTDEALGLLRLIAPVTAVRGNMDHGPWTRALPETAELRVSGIKILLCHDRLRLISDPRDEDVDVVVFGHTHASLNETRQGVLYFNPGCAGPRHEHGAPTVGRLHIEGRRVRGEIVRL